MDSTSTDNQPSKSAPISVRAYARHRGCSAPAVLKAIDRGRLRLSIVIEGGKAKIADVALADREWAQNTDLSRASGEIKERASRHRAASELPVVPPPAPPPSPAPQTPPVPVAQQQTLREESETPGQPPLDPEERWKLNEASAEEKKYKALLAKMEYQKQLGELVQAKDVEAATASLFTVIRTKLLAVPSKARAISPHWTLKDVDMVDRLIREALEELSTPSGTPPGNAPMETAAA